MNKTKTLRLLGAVAAAALTLPAVAQPAAPKLLAVVGPNDTISLKKGSAAVRTLKAGTYTIVVRDRADDHNFRLAGPGVRKQTGIASTGTVTWTVRFQRGKMYRFWCDPHAGEMKGSFRVV